MQQQDNQKSKMPANVHYCRVCQRQRPIVIDDPEQENWHAQDVSVVRCGTCGDQLGHLTWWPALADDDHGIL